MAQTDRLSKVVAWCEIGIRQQGGAHPGGRLGGAFGEGILVAVPEASGSDLQQICGAGSAHMAQRLNFGFRRTSWGDQVLGGGMAELDFA